MTAPMLPRAVRQAFLVPFVAFAVLLGGSFALFSGCGLQTSGIPSEIDAGACVNAQQCDDQEPCTTDTCSSAGECEHTPLADGPAPAADQKKGDCKQIVCKSGVSTTVAETSDAPAPPDMCTATSCKGETPESKPQPDGTPCDITGSSGTCQGGKCKVRCTMSSDCPSMGPCQTAACNGATGTCEYTNLTDGTPTPGVTPVMGDCRTHICLMGQDTNAVDDSDIPTLPAALIGCADAVCTKGTPSFPPHATDSPCSTWMGNQPGFCNASAICSQCTQDGECAGTGQTNDCQHPACTNSVCKQANTPAGTATTTDPPQVPGDCQQIDCDGNGGTIMVPDATDLPGDPTGCNPWSCQGTTPVQTQATDGTACGMGSCGGTQACLGGVCSGCTMNCQCQGGGKTNGQCSKFNTCVCTPSTCAQVGLSCGTAPDGCGGTLNCSGAQNGGETDVDCGGPTAACMTRCIQGQHCSVGSDCKSGLSCVEGVCCDKACGGACEACTAALKGQGQDGVCGAVVAGGADPLGSCKGTAQSTCGETGTCNGSGACADWPGGTSCVSASCSNNVLTKAATCNGTGTCAVPNPPTVSCAPYMCVNNACTSSCSADTDCVSGDYCNASHQCVAKQSNGNPCTAPDQCSSGHCAGAAQGGVCCTSDCTGACQGCTSALTGGIQGTCGNVTTGSADPSKTCAVTSPSGCGTDGNCTSSATCEKYGNSTACGNGTCNPATGMATGQGTCNGSGSCTGQTTVACSPYICGATACLTACGGTAFTDTDCVSGYYCDGQGSGTCQKKTMAGACTNGDECTTGFCVSGFCCNNACNTQCQACSMALTGMANGQCANVNAGTADPSGTCMVSTPASNCGTDGNCKGDGSCEKYGNSTTCTGASTCSGSTLTTKTECDGNGGCTQGGSSGPCPGNLKCQSATMCYASCTNDTQCIANTFCNAGTCVAPQAAGASCTADNQCTSGNCAGGFCCQSSCSKDATCGAQACASGTGACGKYPAAETPCGSPSGYTCGNPHTVNGHICDGQGTCQALNYQCPSNNCVVGTGCMNCGSDNDCDPYSYCSGLPLNICTPQGQSGDACMPASTDECLSGATCPVSAHCP